MIFIHKETGELVFVYQLDVNYTTGAEAQYVSKNPIPDGLKFDGDNFEFLGVL